MTTLNIRTNKKTKAQAAKTLEAIGMNLSSGVNSFLNQVIINKGLPYRPTRDPAVIRAMWDREVVAAMRNGKTYKTAAEALKDL